MCKSNPIIYYVPIPEIISGGVQVIHEHVILLRSIGYESFVLCYMDKHVKWFEHNTPQLRIDQLSRMDHYDIIIPEIAIDTISQFVGSDRKILFAQNWKMLNTHMKRINADSLSDLGYTDVMTCGPAMSDEVLKSGYAKDIPIFTVTNAISVFYGNHLFYPDPQLRVPFSILMLSRRNYHQVKQLSQMFNSGAFGNTFPPISVHVVDGIPQQVLAHEYQRADIYIHTGDNEGLPRPPMEAMACGCAVVGYTGRGGQDFMIHNQTALVAKDGVFSDLVECVSTILQRNDIKEYIRDRGSSFVINTFTIERMKRELKLVFE